MKFLYDFFPILLFFIAYKVQGIFVATAVAIAASIVQVGYFWWRHRRFENMHLVSLAVIVILGGLTILLRDKAFIMWKPTLINWLFAAVFLFTPLFSKRTLIERMLGAQIKLPAAIWSRLNWLWVGFFVFAGVANLYFALQYQHAEHALRSAIPALEATELETLDCQKPIFLEQKNLCETAQAKENLWVNFKLFGLLGLTVIFVFGQAFYLARHIQEEDISKLSDNKDSDVLRDSQ